MPRKNAGRPKKNPAEQCVRVSIALTPEDEATLDALQKVWGRKTPGTLTRSDCIRASIRLASKASFPQVLKAVGK